MSKIISTLTLAALTSAAFAAPAFAGDKMKAEMKPAPTKAMTVVTPVPETQTMTLRSEAQFEVLGAVARGEFTAVEGPDGRIYYNRTIPVSDLPDPTLELRVLETINVNHNGKVYTNKVVQELN